MQCGKGGAKDVQMSQVFAHQGQMLQLWGDWYVQLETVKLQALSPPEAGERAQDPVPASVKYISATEPAELPMLLHF